MKCPGIFFLLQKERAFISPVFRNGFLIFSSSLASPRDTGENVSSHPGVEVGGARPGTVGSTWFHATDGLCPPNSCTDLSREFGGFSP